MPLITGTVLNTRYRIVSLLGQGGFGAVYRAWDLNLNRACAVKENLDTSPEAQKQFGREATLLADLSHPNLVRVIDYFFLPGQGQYFVMDFVEGQDLEQMLQADGPLTVEQVLNWAIQIIAALEYLHTQEPPVIHRDLKPANIKITSKGKAMLVDFGIAKIYDPQLRTTQGARAVTPGFSPPEQYGQGHTDHRTDIYALGATIYTVLTGVVPSDSVDIMTGSAPATVPAHSLNAQIPLPVSQALAKAMQLNRNERFASMAEFGAALKPPASPVSQPEPIIQSHPTSLQPASQPAPAPVPYLVQAAPIPLNPPIAPPGYQPASISRRKLPWGWIAAGGVIGLLLLGRAIFPIGSPATMAPPPEESFREVVATEPSVQGMSEVPNAEPVQIRWYVGLGTGTDETQVPIEQAVVDAFNASQDHIELVLEVIPYERAKDTLAAQISAGAGPDIIGPVGWGGSNAFYGQWLDLTPYIESSGFDTSFFNPALVNMYRTEEGQVGLPFAVFPSALFYNATMFDALGLSHPPAEYGEMYIMPDGSEVQWSWDTMTTVARLLTLDINGNNATSPYFDRNRIVQYGYHPVWSGNPAYMGTFWGASPIYSGEPGNYVADIPENWEAAWHWWYDGIWGEQPFIPNSDASNSSEFGTGNTFGSGRIGMAVTMLWYTCCLDDFASAGYQFQFGILPTVNGVVNGRIDADTFRIWKGTQHPAEAFKVLIYLLGAEGVEPLIVGTADSPGAYGAFPALPEFQHRFIERKAAQYPFVTTWDTLLAGLSYADMPSAEGYMPNWSEAWARLDTFYSLENTTPGLDLDAEIVYLENELTAIFNR